MAAVFLFGVMYKRLTSKGAIAALITGFVLGMGRLALSVFSAKLPGSGPVALFLAGIMDINFLHFGILSFLVCCAVMLIVSRFTKPKTDEELANLTFQTGEFGKNTIMQGNAKLMIILSLLIMAVVGIIWIYFSKLVQG